MPIRFELGADVLQFPHNMSTPILKPLEKLQAIDRSDGGTLQVEDLGIDIRRRTLVFNAIPSATVVLLENWFDNIADGAMNEFSYFDEDDNELIVKILSPIFDFPQFDEDWCSGELLLEVVG